MEWSRCGFCRCGFCRCGGRMRFELARTMEDMHAFAAEGFDAAAERDPACERGVHERQVRHVQEGPCRGGRRRAFAPVRERTARYLAGFDTLDAVLPGGAWWARVIGGEIMAQVRGRSGFGGVA